MWYRRLEGESKLCNGVKPISSQLIYLLIREFITSFLRTLNPRFVISFFLSEQPIEKRHHSANRHTKKKRKQFTSSSTFKVQDATAYSVK